MSSTAQLLRTIAVYGGLPILVCGIGGNILNIVGLWRTRQNPCGFIFLVSSSVNCLVLFYGLLTRILSVGFSLDWSNNNLIWCKNRVAFTQTCFLISLTCICLGSIDRFFASCRQTKFRRFSRLSVAKWAVIITTSIWLGHSIPYFVYSSLIQSPSTGSTVCAVIRIPAFTFYQTYIILPIYLGLLPTMILIGTGLMTYYNTNTLQLHRQRQAIQRQLTLMMLIQIPIVVLSTLPFSMFSMYTILSTSTVKSEYRRNVETIMNNVLTLVFYIAFACQIFVFFISSPAFRKEIQHFLLFWKQKPMHQNQIHPGSTNASQHTKHAVVHIH